MVIRTHCQAEGGNAADCYEDELRLREGVRLRVTPEPPFFLPITTIQGFTRERGGIDSTGLPKSISSGQPSNNQLSTSGICASIMLRPWSVRQERRLAARSSGVSARLTMS